jgi:protein-L-isoaspartate(D-aspartate) O-methyltransferase
MPSVEPHEYAVQHQRLLEEVARDTAETASFTGRARLSPRVAAALAKVQRHRFVPDPEAPFAYINRPRPIGHGQTISQPFIVAIMTELLDLASGDRVLEIGTGSGYQAAILAEVASAVFTIEVVEELAKTAAERLKRYGYAGVEVRHGDGYKGWPERAPFDAIIVTAAPERIPEALVEQLKPGGRLVVPVGPQGGPQALYRCVKGADGKLACENKLPVAFVPMVGDGPKDKRRRLWP